MTEYSSDVIYGANERQSILQLYTSSNSSESSRHIQLFEKHQDIATNLELKDSFRYKDGSAME